MRYRQSIFPLGVWKGSVNELLSIWFTGERVTNEAILRIVDELRAKGTKCYLVSDNEKYRASYVMNEMGLSQRI